VGPAYTNPPLSIHQGSALLIHYDFDYANGRLVLPATAAERGGIQPVVTATANGAARADIKVGEDVELVVTAETAVDGPKQGR
jgi:hypothetical protein